MTKDDIFEKAREPSFPPLYQEQAVTGTIDPFVKACALAMAGCDSGTLVHNVTPDILRAAIVFAPEVPLVEAMSVLPTCGVGFQNALGALAPPEIAVHLKWGGELVVNGATSGRLYAAAATYSPNEEPNWLVVGLEVQLLPRSGIDPGKNPDQTSLYEEGCGDVSPIQLLESWSRHTLVWLNRNEAGLTDLHAEWRGLAHGMGEEINLIHEGKEISGTFLGVDEHFGMLVRSGTKTTLVPLSSILEGADNS